MLDGLMCSSILHSDDSECNDTMIADGNQSKVGLRSNHGNCWNKKVMTTCSPRNRSNNTSLSNIRIVPGGNLS